MASIDPASRRSSARLPLWLRYTLLAALTALVILFSWLTWKNNGGLTPSAFQRRTPIKNPVYVAWDGKDHLYVLDDRYYRILQLTADGRVVGHINSRAVDARHFEYFQALAVDAEGALYAAKVVYFVDTEIVDYEQICRYPPGGAEQVLYTLPHKGDEAAFDVRLVTLQVASGWLYFDVRAEESIALWRVPVGGGTAEQALTINARMADVYKMAGTAPGRLWITSYSGDRVWRLTRDGSLADAGFSPASAAVPSIVLADKLAMAADGSLLITDLFNQCVYSAGADGKLRLRVGKAALPDRPARALFKDLYAAPDGSMAVIDQIWRRDGAGAGEGGRIVLFRPDGTCIREIRSGLPSPRLWLEQLLPWGILAGLVVSFLALLVYVYLAILDRRLILILKLTLSFVPLVVASIAFVTVTNFSRSSVKVQDEIQYRLASLAQAGQRLIDGDAVERIQRPADYLGTDYNAVAGQLNSLLNGTKDPWNQRVFANIARLYNGMFYIMDDYNSAYGVLYPLPLAPVDQYTAALNADVPRTYEYTDADGTYLEAAAAIRNRAGKAVAVLYVGSSKDDLNLLQTEFRRGVIRSTALVTLLLLVAVIAVSLFILYSVNRLRGAVGRMAGGEWDTEVLIRSRDEIGELGQGFNTMSRQLRRYITDITSMSDAYARFVPREFLQFLSKEKVTDIELGNQVEMDMAILFSDIRSFTTISEQMKPQENFNFLNSYLSRIGPVVRRHNGFIDKYMGDGIMALFPTGAADAMEAGVDMQRELAIYNGHRANCGYQPIQIGVGVHAGRVMLGILGEKERMDGTVIADSVNLASRLEGLTKVYGCRIIVAEDLIRQLGDKAPENRFLGISVVKGKAEPVPICEIFAGDPPADLALKRRTRKVFEQAVRLHVQGKRAEALRYFQAVYKIHPGDKPAEYYMEHSEPEED